MSHYRMHAVVLVTAAALWLTASPVAAHHAFASEFDGDKPISLTGTLTKLDWVNPHGWLYMTVKNPDGTTTTWAIEAGSPNALIRRGMKRADFPPGVEIRVEGWRAKDGSNKANGYKVTFADGRNFFMGSSGTGAPKEQ